MCRVQNQYGSSVCNTSTLTRESMELLIPSLTHACILATCADPCLHPGEHHKDRTKFNLDEGVKLPTDAFGTWQALGGEFITIGKYKGNTLVFIPSHDAFYFASPSTLLSQECPDSTVLLGQFVIDTDDTPRVLVFDVAKLQGVSFNNMPAHERYGCLQRLTGCLGSICTLQWVGECKVLASDLKSGRFKVPHAVKGVMALTQIPGSLKHARSE
jgi:hypothetical protein